MVHDNQACKPATEALKQIHYSQCSEPSDFDIWGWSGGSREWFSPETSQLKCCFDSADPFPSIELEAVQPSFDEKAMHGFSKLYLVQTTAYDSPTSLRRSSAIPNHLSDLAADHRRPLS